MLHKLHSDLHKILHKARKKPEQHKKSSIFNALHGFPCERVGSCRSDVVHRRMSLHT